MKILSGAGLTLFRSNNPKELYCYTPWLASGFDGRIFASFDIAGPGLKKLSGPKSDHGDYGSNQLKIFSSDDHGVSWRHDADLPMLHARVFKAGKSLYAIGHSGRLLISRSDDNGGAWSEPSVLEPAHVWHQSGGSIDYRHGKVYLSMEHAPFSDRWAGGDPLLLSAKEGDDLLKPSSWTFSNKLQFEKDVPKEANLFGVAPCCWLESSVVRQRNAGSELYDPEDRTVLLFLRVAGAKFANYAALVAGKECPDGSLSLEFIKQPDGKPLVYVPFPGGYMKFHIAYDEKSKLYWLIASQAVHSSLMKAAPPCGERRRLELFYSENLFDWSSAGLVAIGPCEGGSRHYASILIDGDDLLVLSRSGDESAKDSHDTNMITLHRVEDFRSLALY